MLNLLRILRVEVAALVVALPRFVAVKIMSGKFDGFTKADINNIALKLDKNEPVSRHLGIRRMTDKKMTQPQSTVQKKITTTHPQANQNVIKAKTINLKNNPSSDNESTDDSTLNSKVFDAVHFKPLPPDADNSKDESILNTDLVLKQNEKNADAIEKNASPFKGMSLKDFESQRKLIEEQNRQKRELLYKTIEQQSERTAAEVKKIQEIKKELSKLDSELAADVAILRKQIESASIQYMQVQRHYQQVETVFLKAKVDLHNASEKKELLTEHLCTIIAHNEERKAKKLSELMCKAGISEDAEHEVRSISE